MTFVIPFAGQAAGLRQSVNPGFTAKEIFHMEGTGSYPVIRELGFASICFGSLGILSGFIPGWRIASAFASGIYYGLAGFMPLNKGRASIAETFAMWTDLIIFAVLPVYFILYV